jgi:hypothetical protein
MQRKRVEREVKAEERPQTGPVALPVRGGATKHPSLTFPVLQMAPLGSLASSDISG